MGLCHSGWVGSLTVKPGHMVAVCWDVSQQRMPWVRLSTLAWPLTPYRLHRSLWFDEVKHFIVCFVLGCVFLAAFTHP